MLNEELHNVAAMLRARKLLTPKQTTLLANVMDELAEEADALMLIAGAVFVLPLRPRSRNLRIVDIAAAGFGS